MPYSKREDRLKQARESHARNPHIRKGWADRNPEKRSAHIAVGNAVRDGRLEKGPCERASAGGCSGRINAHHDDYAKPLDIRWLCAAHHSQHHKEMSMTKTKTKDKDAFKEAEKAAKATGDIHVAVLMDESGSMYGMTEAVTTGVNTFLKSFREGKGDVRVTLAWFDHHPGEPSTRFKFKADKIKKIADLTPTDYHPRGMTPLYDAISETLSFIGKKERADEAVFLAIITDGQENSSETKLSAVQEAIAKAKKKGWAIVFLGANIDAHEVATSLGLDGKGQSFNFVSTSAGMQSNIATASVLGTSRRYAGAGASGQSVYAASSATVMDITGGNIGETAPEVEVDEDGQVKSSNK